jgi:putative tricarboxylic transport membrane protein
MTPSNTASIWRPSREVEIIAGTPPGGGQDRPARTMMRILAAAKLVDVPMKVTNIPGKGGGNAWDTLRARAGDPHVLSISAPPLISNRILAVSDFDHSALTPVANLYTEYLAFIVRADSAIQSASVLLDVLKRDPGAIKIALATAIGTINHIALGQLLTHVGADARRLDLRVFESALYAVDDVAAGDAQLGVVSAVSARTALESGNVRVLAVSAPERLAGVFAGAPTWTELSVPCANGQWRGVLAPPGISAEQLACWVRLLGAAVECSLWKNELAAHSWTDEFMTGRKLLAFLDNERVFTGAMLKALSLIS